MHLFQQDGHMAMKNPVGRVNYEPNSYDGEQRGPRESAAGYASYPAEEGGAKRRVRSESFADHYSQARQFFMSQTDIERIHIRDALVFELSKVQREAIRVRLVAHLRNIDEGLAESVAERLGVDPLPDAVPPAKKPMQDLPLSDALSIVKNGPESFAGRKVGVLVTDGVDAKLLASLEKALQKEGALLTIVAPRVAGIEASDGKRLHVDEAIQGGPSVLFDAVVLLPSEHGAQQLAKLAEARDFVADAFAHQKFIGHGKFAQVLFHVAGVHPDAGCVPIEDSDAAQTFVSHCRRLRYFERASSE
jgi:catalase